MALTTAYTTERDATQAAAALKAQIGALQPSFILFFASSTYDPAALGTALRAAFGPVSSIGCTTAGELISGRMLKGSVVLLALDAATASRATTVLVDQPSQESATVRALEALAAPSGRDLGALDPERHIGLVLHDGLGATEEQVMATLTSRTNVPFVGGSAGDDLQFKATHVFVDFVPQRAASALALLETPRPYVLLKTESFDVLNKTLLVTDVDEATRTVRAFNGQPAALEYARLIGYPPAELAAHFRDYPLGLLVGDDEPYVRSPQQVKGTDVVFFCQVKEGMELRLLRSRDIVADTRRDLQATLAHSGPAAGALNFHCILRTLELEEKGQCDAYGALFKDVPMIGFSTYGESYIGHINQTSTMVVFT